MLWTLDQVRVNGPLYARSVQGKDLVADILPPPEYALEAHDLGLQIAREPEAVLAEHAALEQPPSNGTGNGTTA